MQAIIKPGFLQGTISVPPSKSIMQRVCAGALLHKGRTTIHNPGRSEDDKVALRIMHQLGAKIIERSESKIIVESPGIMSNVNTIHCGESGLCARLFTPIAALSECTIRVEGKESVLKRPMFFFEEVLPRLNVSLSDFSGYLPFTVKGRLQPENITIDGSISSQYLTGLLFAFAYAAKQPVEIAVKELKSKPYIALTLQILHQFGWQIKHDNYTIFQIKPVRFSEKSDVEITIEDDWSSAAYWLVGAAIAGRVDMNHLNINSVQADKSIIEILQQCGCNINILQDKVITEQSSLKSFETDLSDCPDLFPIASILASCCKGKSILNGLHRLKHKESDRKKTIMEMLRQFGVRFFIEEDALVIEGKEKLNAARINGHNDHRFVMAAAIGALRADDETTISNAEAVAKSYPDFFQHLASLGVQCELKN